MSRGRVWGARGRLGGGRSAGGWGVRPGGVRGKLVRAAAGDGIVAPAGVLVGWEAGPVLVAHSGQPYIHHTRARYKNPSTPRLWAGGPRPTAVQGQRGQPWVAHSPRV